jgi:hypothetical protein
MIFSQGRMETVPEKVVGLIPLEKIFILAIEHHLDCDDEQSKRCPANEEGHVLAIRA